MDKKLTDNLSNNSPILSNSSSDNEIVKALECLRGKQIFCIECKYSAHLHYRECQQAAANDALDLINRQKSEIERLKDLLNRHQRNTNRIRLLTAETAKKIKVEAYKECIEKVKDEKFKTSVDAYTDAYILGEDDLDNLLKELVGDV